MALTAQQKKALKTLQDRKKAGTIKQHGLDRIKKLKGLKSGNSGGTPKRPFKKGPFKNPEKAAKGTSKDIFNAFSGQLPGVVDQAFTPLDFQGLPAAPGTQDLLGERARIEDSLYGRFTQGYGDEKAQQLGALEQRLAERGITPGSGELYQNELNRFEDQWNERYDTARDRATQLGGQEWQTAFNIGSAGRQNALGEQITAGQYPMQQLQGLMGLAQLPTQAAQGYAGLDQQKYIADLQSNTQKDIANLNAATQKSIASTANTGGGYIAPPERPEY